MTQSTPPTSTAAPAGSAAQPSDGAGVAQPDFIDEPTSKNPPSWRHVAAALGLIAAGDIFFYDRNLVGWTLGLFAGLLLLAMVLLNPRIVKARPGVTLFVLLVGLCASFAESPTLLATALFVAGLAALALADRQHLTAKYWAWAEAALLFLLQGLLRLPVDAAAAPA